MPFFCPSGQHGLFQHTMQRDVAGTGIAAATAEHAWDTKLLVRLPFCREPSRKARLWV